MSNLEELAKAARELDRLRASARAAPDRRGQRSEVGGQAEVPHPVAVGDHPLPAGEGARGAPEPASRRDAPTPTPAIVDYRTPQARTPATRRPAWTRALALPPMVTLSRIIGWTLTAFGALQAVIGVMLIADAIRALMSDARFARAEAILNALVALGFIAGALAVAALGQIVVLLAELVVQGRRREGSSE